MTLKYIVDALDGVDAKFHDLYEKAEGKFRLKVDGVEDTTGLKSALEKERANAKEAKLDGKRVVRVFDADGSPMLVGGKDATLQDLAKGAADKFPSLFNATTKPGSGTQPGGAGRTATKTATRSQFDAMSQADRAGFAKSGGQVVD